MATKNQIARDLYGCAYDDLAPGEKAAVTRRFNSQSTSPASTATAPARSTSAAVRAEFGRVGYNGVKTVFVSEGTNVRDALTQAGITLDTSKEGVQLMTDDSVSTVGLNDPVVHNGSYMISPEVRSA